MTTPSARLRALVARDVPVVIPLALDPLSARLAAAAGFKGLYLGGGTLGYLKTVTEANLTLTQMAQTALEMRSACDLPIVLDGQCGWGDPMHVRQTIMTSEAAGVAAIEIEDQLMPKRAHHHIGLEHLVPTELMVAKIATAVATRRDPDFLIIGRTNACRTDGLDAALRRAEAYRQAGADMLLVLPRTPEEARAIGERIEGPLFYMMLGGVASIGMSLPELGRLGYRLVVDALTPFFAQARALRLAYEALARGESDPTLGDGLRAETERVHAAIALDSMLEIERRTVER